MWVAVLVAPRQQLQSAEPVRLAVRCIIELNALDHSSTAGKLNADSSTGNQKSEVNAHHL